MSYLLSPNKNTSSNLAKTRDSFLYILSTIRKIRYEKETKFIIPFIHTSSIYNLVN